WAQQRLWFIAQLDPQASRAYHVPASLRLSGELDLDALRATLDALLERHEVLRTTFVQNDEGEPLQVIHTDAAFALQCIDLSELDAEQQTKALAEQQLEEANATFDMARGPLIRGRLIELGLNVQQQPDYVLLVTMHHIVSDGWSSGIFVREIRALYEAYVQGRKNPLPPLAIQYADYASWQRTVLDKDRLSTQLDYWREQLEDAPALLTLPLDHPRPSQQDYVGGSIELELDSDLTSHLKAVAQAHGLTLHMLLLSAWSLLLSRLSGQETVVIGTPVANRPRAELEELIGFFVNTLAIRIDVNSGEGENSLTVAQFFDRVKARALGAYAHQDAPFEQVVEELQPDRSLNHSPLF
ncbi:condensation domain-containing protein, partial [Marinobacter sp. NFXS9]|uniref:condensation domain-containing protein n=1 Tax=Marinobacter sp. NFXS9 TaxID=2818433 RepID=UPI0032DF6DC8